MIQLMVDTGFTRFSGTFTQRDRGGRELPTGRITLIGKCYGIGSGGCGQPGSPMHVHGEVTAAVWNCTRDVSPVLVPLNDTAHGEHRLYLVLWDIHAEGPGQYGTAHGTYHS